MPSFSALTVYIAQCYHIYAASALGAMAFSRCFFAIFGECSSYLDESSTVLTLPLIFLVVPLFGRQMYEGLGPGWATSILGFLSVLSIPNPIIFYRWGPRIRKNSKLAVKT